MVSRDQISYESCNFTRLLASKNRHDQLSGSIYTRKGMDKDAMREFEASEANGGDELWCGLGYAYARSGDKRNALRMLSQLKELDNRSGRAAFDVAVVEIGLGSKEKALGWLEKAYEERQ